MHIGGIVLQQIQGRGLVILHALLNVERREILGHIDIEAFPFDDSHRGGSGSILSRSLLSGNCFFLQLFIQFFLPFIQLFFECFGIFILLPVFAFRSRSAFRDGIAFHLFPDSLRGLFPLVSRLFLKGSGEPVHHASAGENQNHKQHEGQYAEADHSAEEREHLRIDCAAHTASKAPSEKAVGREESADVCQKGREPYGGAQGKSRLCKHLLGTFPEEEGAGSEGHQHDQDETGQAEAVSHQQPTQEGARFVGPVPYVADQGGILRPVEDIGYGGYEGHHHDHSEGQAHEFHGHSPAFCTSFLFFRAWLSCRPFLCHLYL